MLPISMSALLRRLLDRTTKKVNRVAAGTPVPAGIDPDERKGPTARERTLMRRRLRALRRRREALTRDGNGIALESTQELEAVDAERHALEQALKELKTLDELLASGVSGRCANCGELVSTREHYCTNCGAEQPSTHRPAPAPKGPPPQRAPVVTGASSARAQTPPGR